MYISLKWVQELIGLQNLTLIDLVNRLTLAGFEIESINKKKYFKSKDLILDISFTANRADVSNMRGLITEIIALFNSNLFLQTPANIKPLILLNSYKKTLNSIEGFHSQSINYKALLKSKNFGSFKYYRILSWKYSLWERYLQKKSFSHVIKNLTRENLLHSSDCVTLFNIKSQKLRIKESPYWIKKRLLLMGFKSVNNVIDTINYLLFETGQVFFAYDLETLQDLTETSEIVFVPNYAKEKSLFPIEESKTIQLTNNVLVLNINNKMVSIAGLIQNYHTLVNTDTSYIIIQYGLYESKKIKKSSKILGLRTDYSIKLEKQTDLNLIEQAHLRLMHLFWTQDIKFEQASINKNLFFSLKNNSSLLSKYIKQSEKKIKIVYENLKRLTGPSNTNIELSNSQIITNLKLLNFKVRFETGENCYLFIPLTRRLDIEREVDVIEEVVRTIGFNKFEPLTLRNDQIGYLTKIEKLKRRLRNYFINLGFNESIHSILMKKNSEDEIRLKNPLFNESSALRLSLLDGLIEKIQFNQKNIGESFETFELGRVYKLLIGGDKKEVEVISGVFGGKNFRSNWGSENSTINWFEAKGLLENLFEKLNIPVSIYWNPATNYTTKFHPNLTTELFIGNQKLGIFGQIHPTLALENNINRKIYLFEMDIEILNRFSQSKTLINYLPYSSYPISNVDLSFIVKKSIFSEEIKQIIFKFGQPLLKYVSLFDYYSNEPIKKGYCSLSFKLQFQSKNRTLSSDEVEELINPIIFYLEKHYDIKFQE
uniref:phenylalanyl tRNA synthetase beta subunit n=1 Tax=Dictyoneurum californicum TaxID=169784 RepID=UPI002E78988D|nr:phenylalanyl tRNA synthetase beta subunit [Dictyoneurum californicum]WAM63113.1 phenylalanyl tRNA synthetase beta subunit [Dictyoneurum californicum]